jgi:hypothetical protein
MLPLNLPEAVEHHSARQYGLSVESKMPGVWRDRSAFVPYWDPAGRIRSETEDIFCSAWRVRGTNLLAVVSNYNRVPVKAKVRLDTQAIARRRADEMRAADVESAESAVAWHSGVLELEVAERDYRLVLLE